MRFGETRTFGLIAQVGMIAAMACGGRADHQCPSGTTRFELHGASAYMCMMEDGRTPHGPYVQIDEQGRPRVAGRIVRGKREGRWVLDEVGGVRTESVYVNGLLDGDSTVYVGEKKAFSMHYRAGIRHGTRTVWDDEGRVASEQHHDRGVPTGTWRRYGGDGSVIATRAYGPDGVLVAIDGRSVPAPPARLELPDGSAIARTECLREAREILAEDLRPRCLLLFEAMQACTLAEDPACASRALEQFARGGVAEAW